MSLANPLSTSDILKKTREFYEVSPATASEEMRKYLLDYFFDPMNRLEIDNSPNRLLTTKSAVELLMTDIDTIISELEGDV